MLIVALPRAQCLLAKVRATLPKQTCNVNADLDVEPTKKRAPEDALVESCVKRRLRIACGGGLLRRCGLRLGRGSLGRGDGRNVGQHRLRGLRLADVVVREAGAR